MRSIELWIWPIATFKVKAALRVSALKNKALLGIFKRGATILFYPAQFY